MDWWEHIPLETRHIRLNDYLNEPTGSMYGDFYKKLSNQIKDILEKINNGQLEEPEEDPLAFDELDEIREELEALQKEQDRLAEEAHLPDDAD